MSASPVLAFDIDGVILRSRPWAAELKADWGIELADLQAGFLDGPFQEVLRGRLDLFVALNDYLGSKGLADRLEAFAEYWFEKESTPESAVLDKIAAWKQRTGGRCFAASNQEHHRIAYLRDTVGLGAHFDEIVYSAALGVCKPDRVFFTNAQARMGITVAQSILFVDDSAECVDAARMCGWRAMLYRGSESLAKALAQWG